MKIYQVRVRETVKGETPKELNAELLNIILFKVSQFSWLISGLRNMLLILVQQIKRELLIFK